MSSEALNLLKRRCPILFPQLGPAYYDEKDRGILSRMEAFYAEGITINQSFWGEAKVYGLYKSSLIDLETLRGDRAQA